MVKTALAWRCHLPRARRSRDRGFGRYEHTFEQHIVQAAAARTHAAPVVEHGHARIVHPRTGSAAPSARRADRRPGAVVINRLPRRAAAENLAPAHAIAALHALGRAARHEPVRSGGADQDELLGGDTAQHTLHPGCPRRWFHATAATRCVCIGNASAVDPHPRPNSRIVFAQLSVRAPPPPNSVLCPAENTRCAARSR